MWSKAGRASVSQVAPGKRNTARTQLQLNKTEIETRYRWKPDILSNTMEFRCGVKWVGRRYRKSWPVNEARTQLQLNKTDILSNTTEFRCGVKRVGRRCRRSRLVTEHRTYTAAVEQNRDRNDISEMAESQPGD
jgi:hypothetical protein